MMVCSSNISSSADIMDNSTFLAIFENSSTTEIIVKHTPKVITTIDFYPLGLTLCILCIFGLVGNFLSARIILRFKSKSTYTFITLGLTFVDSVYLLTKLIRYGLAAMFNHYEIFTWYNAKFLPFIGPHIRAITFTAHTGSTYFTIAVALDRYMVICWPLMSRFFWTKQKAHYISAIMISWAILYNIPRWFEFHTVEKFYQDSNETYYKMETTPLRKNPDYQEYYIFWAYLFIMNLTPFLVLSYFNLVIWRAIRNAQKNRESLMTNQEKDENSFGLMLIGVVIVFLLCNLDYFVLDILDYIKQDFSDFWQRLGNVLLTVNSAINFLLYCFCGTKFRREALKMLQEILSYFNFETKWLEKRTHVKSTKISSSTASSHLTYTPKPNRKISFESGFSSDNEPKMV